MENQHRIITGYRDLSQAEIDLMNEIKAKGKEIEALVVKVRLHADAQMRVAHQTGGSEEALRLDVAEPARWAAIGRTHFQEGLMALARAVAQPTSF